MCRICMGHYHHYCVDVVPPHDGPWHCKDCLAKAKDSGIKDITLDKSLMHFVCLGTHHLEADSSTQLRVEEASGWV